MTFDEFCKPQGCVGVRLTVTSIDQLLKWPSCIRTNTHTDEQQQHNLEQKIESWFSTPNAHVQNKGQPV